MSRNRPEPGDQYIDSRDVIKAIEELSSEREALAAELRDALTASDEDASATATDALAEWDEEYGEELAALQTLEEQCSYGDWRFGETLILDSEFENYARQLADDIGAIKGDEGWPMRHIDWKAAADELKQDYTSADFGDFEYWIRAT